MYHHGNTLIKLTLHDETKKRAQVRNIAKIFDARTSKVWILVKAQAMTNDSSPVARYIL